MAHGLTDWFEGLVPIPDDADEALFCQAWRAQLAPADCTEYMRAVRGGWLANNLSQVFIAGYQAAIRQTFPQVDLPGLAAFAVSEDRSESAPLPGVVWHPKAEGVLLSGYKTWVAAAAQVECLVVKARGSEPGQSGYFLLPVALDEVQVDVYSKASRLPDLSQGRVFLDQVVLSGESRLDESEVAGFGRREALLIYSAFLAWVWRSMPAKAPEKHLAATLLQDLKAYFATPPAAVDLQRLDANVQNLRRQLADGQWSDDADFLRDQTLISMYSRGLRNH